MSGNVEEALTDAAPAPTRATAIGRLAARLTRENADLGERAELRRLARGGTNQAFWRVLMTEVPEELTAGKASEDLWAALLAAFALLAPLGSGRQEKLGKALGETGYSEPRLLRLLRAEAGDIRDELVTAAQWLVAHGRAADWLDLANFVFSRRDREAGSDHPAARRIARDYFTAVSRIEGKKS